MGARLGNQSGNMAQRCGVRLPVRKSARVVRPMSLPFKIRSQVMGTQIAPYQVKSTNKDKHNGSICQKPRAGHCRAQAVEADGASAIRRRRALQTTPATNLGRPPSAESSRAL